MMDYDFLHALLRSSMALFIILDPVGLLPVVMAVTVNQEPAERQRVLYRSALVAFGLTLLLTFTAKAVFSLYGMQIADFQIAGGVVLFLVALQTIHDRHMGEDVQQAAGIVPIACPLLVGPGALVTSILTLKQYGPAVAVSSVVVAFAAVLIVFRFTGALFRLLGQTGAGVVARLAGMLLAGIAIQFIREGVVTILRSAR